MDQTNVAAVPPPAPPGAAPYRWRWAALFVILAAEVMDMVDGMITNIAAPSIRADIGGGPSTIQWLGAAYTLAMAVGLITGGRLGDIAGRKRMFLIGAAGFTLGSLLCGLAWSPGVLIAARVIQGAFGAVMLPQGLGMIKEMFPPKEMQAAFGMFGPVMGLASVGGPILGGWLVEADLLGTGWRMIFLINLPLGMAALLAGVRFLPGTRSADRPRLDIPGVLLAALGAFLVIYPLVQGREHGWPLWAFLMIAGSAAVFAFFGRYEARKTGRGGDPLITPSLFRKRAFAGGLLTMLAFFAPMIGLILVFNVFTQVGLGYSTLQAGLAMVPWSIGTVAGFGVAQALRRFGRAVLHLGLLIEILGMLGLLLTLHWAGLGLTPWQLVPALAVTGVGQAMVMAPFFDIVLAGVEPEETGSASGTLTAVQQLGGALGVALIGTVFFDLLGDAPMAADFDRAMQTTVWVIIAMFAVSLALAYLLPEHAREDAGTPEAVPAG